MDCLIVGGGIMGLSTAWALRRNGHSVTLLEQGAIPNPLGSSVDRHRLIRYPYGAMRGYAALIDDAYSAWNALWDDLGETHYIPTGCLALSCADGDWTSESCETMDELGQAYERLAPQEIETRYPHLSMTGIEWGFATSTGGALLADRIVADLYKWLAVQKADVRTHTRVTSIDPGRASVTLQDGTKLAADAVVVTAGPWVTRLCPRMDSRVTPSRQVVVYIEAPEDIHAAWARTPVLIDLGVDAGFYTVPPVAGHHMKVGDHSFSLTGDPDRDRDAQAGEVQRIFDSAAMRFRGLDRCRIADARTCFYTVSPDERFIVEAEDNCWIATGFSGHGFKFGALVGLTLAEALGGTRAPSDIAAWAAGSHV